MKTRGPLLSFSAKKSIANSISFRRSRNGTVATRHSTPSNPRSPNQILVRARLGAAVAAWTNVLEPADTQAAWNRFSTYTRSRGSGYTDCIGGLMRNLVDDPDPSFIVDCEPFTGYTIRWRLRDVISDRYATEAGDFELWAGTEPGQLKFFENLSLVGSCLFSSPLAATSQTVYVAIRKSGIYRSGIYQIALANPAWFPIAWKRTIAWWIHDLSMASALAGDYKDASSLGAYDGTQPTALYRPAWVGDASKSLDFDGANDSVIFPSVDSLKQLERMSLSYWFNYAPGAGGGQTVGWCSLGAVEYFRANYNSAWMRAGKCRHYFQFVAPGVNSIAYTSFYATPGSWHHTAFVYDPTRALAPARHLPYEDGALSVSVPYGTPPSSLSSSAILSALGRSPIWQVGFYEGKLSEILVWDTDLAPADIQDTYNNQRGLF